MVQTGDEAGFDGCAILSPQQCVDGVGVDYLATSIAPRWRGRREHADQVAHAAQRGDI